MSRVGDWRFVARTGLALVVANARYWLSVAPVVRHELRRWERQARRIEDPELQRLALRKLGEEGFNAEAAAMLATLAPRAHRGDVVRAIVALELLFDCLDGLTELPAESCVGEHERLFEAFTAATRPHSEADVGARLGAPPHRHDYLQALSETVSATFARLPATSVVVGVAQRIAACGAQTQIDMHAAGRARSEQLAAWARDRAEEHGPRWREQLAGSASSVLVLHALLAAAADPRTTPAEALEIESAYLSICVLLTLLDGLVDHDRDRLAGDLSYIGLYEDRDELARTLAGVAAQAVNDTRGLRNGAHHTVVLAGAVAYYLTAPGARSEFAAPIAARLRSQLRPLLAPTLAVLRVWRQLKLSRRVLLGIGGARRASSRGAAGSVGVGVTVALLALGGGAGAARGNAGARGRSRGDANAQAAVRDAASSGAVARLVTARAERLLNVRDEGRLRFVTSAGSQLIDEGPATGTIPGKVRVRFLYDGDPLVAARFTIYGSRGSISGRATVKLSNPTSPDPSFRGALSITGGGGRFARAHGAGELFGVFNRRSYGLTVQAIGRLDY